jgi:hypothetical protein
MPWIEAFSFLTAQQSLVEAELWQIGDLERQQALPSVLKDWDPLTDLHLQRTMSVDFPQIFSNAGLSQGSELVVAASWQATGTTLKENPFSLSVTHGSPPQPVNLKFTVTGSKLAGRLLLFTRILLKKRGKTDRPLAATRTGAILWQDEVSVDLEGLGARFPIQFADFADLGLPANAGWALHWKKKEFQAQFMGNVWLLINVKHERLRGIVSGAISDPQAPAILAAIHFSVAREMISTALATDEFLEAAHDYPQGSIGEAIRLLMRRTFGDDAPEAIQQMRQNEPHRFECQLQDSLKLFHAALGASPPPQARSPLTQTDLPLSRGRSE